jgi:urease accessory protein
VNGTAELVFCRERGRTILEKSRVEAPMAVVRPFALPDGGLVIQMVSLGPGLCGGDSITVDVRAGRGTRVAVTTTAATRVMSMDSEARAEQRVLLRAEADAVLEYYPCPTIPYPASALWQTIDVDAAPGARVGVVECWAMGRTARSEYLAFRSLMSRTTIACEGRRTYVDVLQLEPQAADLSGAGVLAGRRYLASGVWTGVGHPLDDEQAASSGDGDTVVAFGPSSPAVAYLRALGTESPCVDRVVRASVERVSRSWGLVPVCLSRFHN